MAGPLSLPISRIEDANGRPYAGAKLYAYLTGGTTPTPTYTTSALSVAHTNPVVADSGGLLPVIYPDPAVTYRYVIKTSAGVPISGMDFDPVSTENLSDVLLVAQVHLYRQVADTDDTSAFTRALATGLPVRFVGGEGSDTDGAYLLGMVSIPAGSIVFGDGPENTIVRDIDGTGGTNGTTGIFAMFDLTSGSSTTTVDNVHISDLQMQGVVGAVGGHIARGFREHRHCINLRGVKNVTIERCKFYGWRGDAICLSGDVVTPTTSADYRHNFNVLIQNNIFDGDTSDNRQATSVLDCTGFCFRGNEVRNCTRSNMPGAVDFEPSPYALYILRDLKVIGNLFENVGGNIGVVCLEVPSVVTTLPVGLRIEGNTFQDCDSNTGADIALQMNRTFNNANADQHIVITGNRGSGGSRPFNLFSAKGVRIDESNVWESYGNGAIIGFTAVTGKPYGCTVRPTLKSCGFAGLQVYRGDYLTLGGNYTDTATVAIFLDGVAAAGDGTTNVTISGLKTNVGAGTMSAAIAKSANHSVSATTNRLLYDTCELSGLTVAFPAQDQRGTAVLVAGTVTVAATGAAATSRIFVQRQTGGGTLGDSYSIAVSAGVSFTLTSKTANATVAGDTSTLIYAMAPA